MEAEKPLFPNVPPFLTKCFDMVENPSTDEVVSWSETDNSFVIWDPHSFSRDFLPKYFKHGNLSSFVRQLNTYGFRKVDPDRLEFANEGFLRGQKHLLKTITRRKPGQNIVQPQQSQGNNTYVKACVEVGRFGLEEEIQRLKRDKDTLKQELIKLRQHQQNSDDKLCKLIECLQGMEQSQQQMMSFLALVMQSPDFLAHLVQQNGSNIWMTESNKKRRFPALEQGSVNGFEHSADGQIIKYQPFVTETSNPVLMQEMNADMSGSLQPMFHGVNNLFMNVDPTSLEANQFLQGGGSSPLPDFSAEDFDEILASQDMSDFILDFDAPEQDIEMEASMHESEMETPQDVTSNELM